MKRLLTTLLSLFLCSGCSCSAKSDSSYLHLKDTRTVDIRTYGAIPGDGIDDTTAIQTAINYARGGDHPSTVIIPEGKWNISSPGLNLDWASKAITMRGESKPSWWYADTNTKCVIVYTGSGTAISAIGAWTANMLTIENIAFVGTAHTGTAIQLMEMSDYTIRQCTFQRFAKAIHIKGSDPITPGLNNNAIIGKIYDNEISSNTVGLQATGNQPNMTHAIGNTFNNNGTHIRFDVTDMLQASLCRNNFEYSTGTQSVVISAGKAVSIDQNYWEEIDKPLLTLGYTNRMKAVTVTNNFMGAQASDSATIASGVISVLYCDDLNVGSNFCSNLPGTVFVNLEGYSTDFIIKKPSAVADPPITVRYQGANYDDNRIEWPWLQEILGVTTVPPSNATYTPGLQHGNLLVEDVLTATVTICILPPAADTDVVISRLNTATGAFPIYIVASNSAILDIIPTVDDKSHLSWSSVYNNWRVLP